MTDHVSHPHLRDDLPYPKGQNALILDAPRALLHVGRCPCGADTVRPIEADLVALMADEWGVACTVDKAARAYVLSLTYDPVERDDLASGNVWPEAS